MPIIQGRIKTNELIPINNIKVFRINSIDKETKLKYKQLVNCIAGELYKTCVK